MMLTIFTPTYNRAAYLSRLYDSLLCQNNKDFEWLIVDDGSTDNTLEVVQRFVEQDTIPIRYFCKANGGKHTAYNEGLQHARGEWFLCVDADDFLHEPALERISEAVNTITDIRGIAAYKQDTNGNRLGDPFPSGVDHCKISDLSLKYGCCGEFTYIFPTAIAKKYPFPIFDGEKFVGENVVYDRIEQECDAFLLPEVITVCEYLEDGYSQNFGKLLGQNPSGFCVYFMQRIDLMPSLISKMICAGKYWCFRWISKNKTLQYAGKYRFICGLGWPLGLVFRGYYKLVRGF